MTRCALAGRALTADDCAAQRCPADRQLELFLDLWTRMEARQRHSAGHIRSRVDPGDMIPAVSVSTEPLHFASLAVRWHHLPLSLRFFDYSGP